MKIFKREYIASNRKKFAFLLFNFGILIDSGFSQQMEFKVVSPQGNVSANHFPTIDACQYAVRSFATGSFCTAFPKDNQSSSQQQMEFKVVSPQGNVSSNYFPTIDGCRIALPSFARGSSCMPFSKN